MEKILDKNGKKIQLGSKVLCPNGDKGRVSQFGEDDNQNRRLLITLNEECITSSRLKGYYPNELQIIDKTVM